MSAIYNQTPPTLASGQSVSLQADASGNLRTSAQGAVASGATDSGNPVKIGGPVQSTNTAIGTAGQRVNATFSADGSIHATVVAAASGSLDASTIANTGAFSYYGNGAAVIPGIFNYGSDGANIYYSRNDANGTVVQPALSSTFWAYAAAAGGIVSSTADVAVKAAAGAGVRNYLSSLQVAHDLLSAVTEFVIKDGATIIHRGKLQTVAIDGSGGAGSIKFDPPLRGTANTALNFALLTSVTGGVFVNAQGYTGS